MYFKRNRILIMNDNKKTKKVLKFSKGVKNGFKTKKVETIQNKIHIFQFVDY